MLVLAETPYALEGKAAAAVSRELERLSTQVRRLREHGTLDERTLGRLRRVWKVEQVYETTGIEGNTLDLNETRLVLERGMTVTGKSQRDQTEAQNMTAALDHLEELARARTPFSGRDLREIQSLVVGDDLGSGEYRTNDVAIAGSTHEPPPPVHVAAQVDDALRWLDRKRECPPPLSAAVMHAWIAHIHPFTDGNGRTARAVMNLILIRRGFPIVLIRRKDRTRYYDALAASDEGDIAPLVALIVQRSGDSLRQIVRLRAAETGLTDAVRRAEERLRAQYDTWHQAMLLLLRSIAEAGERARDASDGNVRLSVREYDQVTLDDYQALLRQDPSGNGWLAVLRGRCYTRQSELLLWNGFRSMQMAQLGKTDAKGASIFLSEPDPEREHGPFRRLQRGSRFPIREIAFDGGNYLVLSGDEPRARVRHMKADELALEITKQFVEYYLT